MLQDIHVGKIAIRDVKTQEYLGEILSFDGSNKPNLKKKVAKAQAVINDIILTLESSHLGQYYFEIAKTLRNSLFLSVLLNNSEVWYNVSKADIRSLEAADSQLLKRILETSSKASPCLLLLELGFLPVRFILKMKRLRYFHFLLKSDGNSLAKQVLM